MANDPTILAVATHWEAIKKAAARHGVGPYILAGLVAAESGGNQWAVRLEPHYRWLFGDDSHEADRKPRGSTRDTEWAMQRVSWGLCQVMGAVARELGFDGWLPELTRPETGLDFGARYLAKCLQRTGHNLTHALLRYNGGGDPEYPGKVLGWVDRIRMAGLA